MASVVTLSVTLRIVMLNVILFCAMATYPLVLKSVL
jgi:hypothetical protein